MHPVSPAENQLCGTHFPCESLPQRPIYFPLVRPRIIYLSRKMHLGRMFIHFHRKSWIWNTCFINFTEHHIFGPTFPVNLCRGDQVQPAQTARNHHQPPTTTTHTPNKTGPKSAPKPDETKPEMDPKTRKRGPAKGRKRGCRAIQNSSWTDQNMRNIIARQTPMQSQGGSKNLTERL